MIYVEEVIEVGDLESEQSYFVLILDEYFGGYDRDDGLVYGQIYIEEEFIIRYFWQDEIVQGIGRRIQKDGVVGEKVVKFLEILVFFLEGDLGFIYWKE